MKRSLSLLLVLSLLCALLAGCSGRRPARLRRTAAIRSLCPKQKAQSRAAAWSRSVRATRCCSRMWTASGATFIRLTRASFPWYREPTERGELLADSQLAAGALIEVAYGGDILESYPALFGGVERITVLPDEFDDRCALYLRVLGDLWGKDTGLNGGADYISVDLAATSLTPAERSAVAWTFAQSHGAEPMELSYEQLCAEGYISGLTGENAFPQWEKGILFTITETNDPVTFNLPSLSEGGELPSMTQYNIKNTVSFDASKWRTALGAYGFSECVAVQNNDGVWGDYHINGPEWIS